MADVESNILEHESEFLAFVAGISFTMPGRDQSLGRDLAVKAAEGIVERTAADQKAADGGPLKPNAPAYKARKIRKHGVGLVGVLTGQMLSLESVLGKPEIAADEVTMAYGTGEASKGFATSGTLKQDEPTDRQKGEWFTAGGRPFYELDDAIAEELYKVAGEALEDYIAGA